MLAKCLAFLIIFCQNKNVFLLTLTKEWKRTVDSCQILSALLPDISKASNCLDHELLIAKLNAFIIISSDYNDNVS